MSVSSTHPSYKVHLPDWNLLADTYAGEREIKDQGVVYLSPTSGQVADGMQDKQPGRQAYEAYKMRARFPDIVKVAVDALTGVLHSKPPTIELPDSMEDMRDNATLNGESLEVLLRRINEQQLITGRLGLLLDVPDGAAVGTMPYIAMYKAKEILNWDNGTRDDLVLQNLNLVTLDESEFVRDSNFEWVWKEKYRIAVLGDPVVNEPKGQGTYQVGVFTEKASSFNNNALVTPSLGGRTLDEIPFVFINSTDIVPHPNHPPLLGLAQLAVGIYRGEADYRQALFMQGQDTLVVAGVTDPDADFRTGANAAIVLPTGGEAKFIGVESAGISEMREALENDKSEASQRGGQLLDAVSRQKESGDALRIRVTARTATLNQIAKTGAFGLETSLKQVAKWIGANPDDVKVVANTDFVDDELPGKTLVEYMTAKSLGAPMSLESVHKLMQEKGLTELDFEEELDLIAKEEPMGGAINEDGLEDEEVAEE
ncbi:DUF4055 domain-containing protein [Candidatus Pacearchaeota archaeon]|nr:DUF4055 domain-containing protein [Candidatus Pacearchaeota archaeon]